MPTILSHAIVVGAAGQWWRRRDLPPNFWTWTMACSMLPDIDVIGFSFGIQYGDMFGHRGFTHSLFFALLAGGLAAWQIPTPESQTPNPTRVQLFLWFAAVTASHGVLDAMTNGGRGIAFFAPFSNHRYFFPWRPIQVSPIGAGFFSSRGLSVLASEAFWIWAPSAIIALSARLFRRPT
jgi:inner membrane protein